MVLLSHQIPYKISIGGWFPLPRAQSPAEHPTSQDWRRRRAEPNWHSRFCLAALRRGKMWKNGDSMAISWWFNGWWWFHSDVMVISCWFQSCLLVISWDEQLKMALMSQNPCKFLVNTEKQLGIAGCSSSHLPEKWLKLIGGCEY